MKRPLRIYVASSWRNPLQPGVVSALRADGHDVYDFREPGPGERGFSWREVDTDWLAWTPDQFIGALQHPIAQAGFENDSEAMKGADACVLVLPCGRSAHLEAGWFAGAGRWLGILLDDLSAPTPGHTMVEGAPCKGCNLPTCRERLRRERLREPELMYSFANLISPRLAEIRAALRTKVGAMRLEAAPIGERVQLSADLIKALRACCNEATRLSDDHAVRLYDLGLVAPSIADSSRYRATGVGHAVVAEADKGGAQ